eukprot:TRINITY_DN807_c0_g5_i1.p1 TRINITY_DN807_c0_g5~~TRINITY_DN807_c0_g5_i1.p1  ORF type:complete len:268 (+),score=53.65 TRINITY_DN807_c0_g5_i1:112-915(+)
MDKSKKKTNKIPNKKQNSEKNLSISTDSEEALLEKLSKYRDELATKAHTIVHFEFPKKVFYLEKLLQEPIWNLELSEIGEEPTSTSSTPNTNSKSEDTNQSKKRKLSESAEENDNKNIPSIPSNKIIAQLVSTVKKEVIDMTEMVTTVKLWIHLNIPRIEDGNNFGVGIQEETLGELGRIEEAAAAILESLTNYFIARAKLLSRAHKYPAIADCAHAVKEFDEKEYLNLRCFCIDLRNNYAILHDMIVKNLEKITKPRASNHMESLF